MVFGARGDFGASVTTTAQRQRPRDHGDKGLRNGYSEMKTGTH